jgi:hypothetical protein
LLIAAFGDLERCIQSREANVVEEIRVSTNGWYSHDHLLAAQQRVANELASSEGDWRVSHLDDPSEVDDGSVWLMVKMLGWVWWVVDFAREDFAEASTTVKFAWVGCVPQVGRENSEVGTKMDWPVL